MMSLEKNNSGNFRFVTIHILRKHLWGGWGLENGNFCLFSVHKIYLHMVVGGWVQKA